MSAARTHVRCALQLAVTRRSVVYHTNNVAPESFSRQGMAHPCVTTRNAALPTTSVSGVGRRTGLSRQHWVFWSHLLCDGPAAEPPAALQVGERQRPEVCPSG